jgi:aromatic-L-amino-acid decarboxylase
METNEFRKAAHQLVDWMADYMEGTHRYPVKPALRPGDIKKQLPDSAPEKPESFDKVFKDFNDIVMPGMTHWQHPKFFAYFPTGASAPSVLAEMLSATLGAQCMIWLTSPAAEEVEERMMEWLRDLLGLPRELVGVIQDSSSSATLVALLTAREKHANYAINQKGFTNQKYRVYTSVQAHSSVDKDVRIAGIGIDNLIKIDVDKDFAMKPEALRQAIAQDVAQGYHPLCVVSTMGSTSSTAIDPIAAIDVICKEYGCWHHVDASYAGTALLLPEMRWMSRGVEGVDSFVLNPHKWMFTNFDCSAYYVRDKQALTSTFSILPEYLKTPEDHLVNNYRDWGVPLGRRFRALKLWFVMRSFGAEGLREKIREHIRFGQWLKDKVDSLPDFERLAPVPLNLVCFRYHPKGVSDEKQLDDINMRLLQALNDSGKILLTQTKLNNQYTLRFVGGSERLTLVDVQEGWQMVESTAHTIA